MVNSTIFFMAQFPFEVRCGIAETLAALYRISKQYTAD